MKPKVGLCVLQWALGVVILIEAVIFVLPNAAHQFAHLHIPGLVGIALEWGKIVGAVLLLIPPTVKTGAWLLFAVLMMGLVVHLLHGQYNVGNVVVYAGAAFAIAMGKN